MRDKQWWLEHFLEMCEKDTLRLHDRYRSKDSDMYPLPLEHRDGWRLAILAMDAHGFDICFYGMGDGGYYFTWQEDGK